jgi:outer membrane receptor protein involved in Fe transport
VTGFDNVVNDVEYSAAFLSPTAIADNAGPLRAPRLRAIRGALLPHPARGGKTLDLDISDKNYGGYVQDTWKAGYGVTLNLGLRYDKSSLFGDDNNNFAPRLGAAWDVGQKGQTVVRANWGPLLRPQPPAGRGHRARRRAGSSRAPPSTWPCRASAPTTRTPSSTS